MNEYVKVICETCFYHLHNIAAIEKLMHVFITSRLDNCYSLLINVPASILHNLQRVQNTAVRIIMRRNKRDSISAILKQLHWLPVKQRVMFKVHCITHKCVYGPAPTYLSELVQPYVICVLSTCSFCTNHPPEQNHMVTGLLQQLHLSGEMTKISENVPSMSPLRDI